jgi:hypothetical protein
MDNGQRRDCDGNDPNDAFTSPMLTRIMSSLARSHPLWTLLSSTSPPSSTTTTSLNVWPEGITIPLTLITLISEYHLTYDSIASACEHELVSYYPSMSMAAITEFKMEVGAQLIADYHDPQAKYVRLAKLSYLYWSLSTQYDDPASIQILQQSGRAHYKMSLYQWKGYHAGATNQPVYGIGVSTRMVIIDCYN